MKSVLPFRGDDTLMYSITYDLVTPESASEGGYAESGYVVEPNEGELQDILLESNRDYGIYKPVGVGVFVNTQVPEDKDYFEKGHEKYYTLTITKGDGSRLNQEELDFVTALLNEGKYYFDEESNRFYEWGGTPEYGIGGWIGGTVIGGFLGYQVGKAVGYGRAVRGYEDGGVITSDELDKLNTGFTLEYLDKLLSEKFPYSHNITVIEGRVNEHADYKKRVYGNSQIDRSISGMKFTFPDNREHAIEYEVQQGSENTNYQFVIYDSEILPYTVLWGFKDEGDVDSSYVTKAVAFLQQAYGYPMTVKHTVMSKGGSTYEGGGNISQGQKKEIDRFITDKRNGLGIKNPSDYTNEELSNLVIRGYNSHERELGFDGGIGKGFEEAIREHIISNYAKGGSTYEGGGNIESVGGVKYIGSTKVAKSKMNGFNIIQYEDIEVMYQGKNSLTLSQIRYELQDLQGKEDGDETFKEIVYEVEHNMFYADGGATEGYHQMPDGTIMPDSAHYGLGGLLLAGGFGAYIGYKVGRARPQKKGFDTEKKIARKVKEGVKDLKKEKKPAISYAGGGEITRQENSDPHGSDAFLMGYEPYFEKNVEIANIDDANKTVSPTHGYYPNHPLSKKAMSWAKKNGYSYVSDGKSYAGGGEVIDTFTSIQGDKVMPNNPFTIEKDNGFYVIKIAKEKF